MGESTIKTQPRVLVYIIYIWRNSIAKLWKESLNSDGHRPHQDQQNGQTHLTSNQWTQKRLGYKYIDSFFWEIIKLIVPRLHEQSFHLDDTWPYLQVLCWPTTTGHR